jgi:hypothetical protein
MSWTSIDLGKITGKGAPLSNGRTGEWQSDVAAQPEING